MKQLSFDRTLVMGILNLTPDSFFDGGKYLDPDQAEQHWQQLVADGADIIDIGAASSRPGYQPVSAEEELARLQPFLPRLRGAELPWSIDTDKPVVAEAALAAGAAIVNHTGYPSQEMAALARRYQAYLVIMFHGPFTSGDYFTELRRFFAAAIDKALAAGVDRSRLIIDPGIGFEMTMEQCIAVVRGQAQLLEIGCPLLMGMSNKRFIGVISGQDEMNQRGAANIAAELFAAEQGAAILRVHDVAATVSALRADRALRGC